MWSRKKLRRRLKRYFRSGTTQGMSAREWLMRAGMNVPSDPMDAFFKRVYSDPDWEFEKPKPLPVGPGSFTWMWDKLTERPELFATRRCWLSDGRLSHWRVHIKDGVFFNGHNGPSNSRRDDTENWFVKADDWVVVDAEDRTIEEEGKS